MFKATRVLQAVFICAVLYGCAARQPAALPKQATPPTSPSETSFVRPAADFPSVRAGRSVDSAEAFTLSDGKLTPDIQAYAREVSLTRGVPLETVELLLSRAQYNPTVSRLMSPAKTRVRKSWVTYKNRHVDPVRISRGMDFWQTHRASLDAAAAQYGVPQAIIVAIIGIETIYGSYTGDFRVLDSLATLGFRYPDPSRPERSQMFRDQLADLIYLHHQGQLNALQETGSFAGAMGLPQFMPGSLLRYAVDGDNDGRIELLSSPADAIFSVANFLRAHGWEPGLPVFAPVVLPSNAKDLAQGGLTPNYEWKQLESKGARLRPGASSSVWQRHPIGVIDLVDEPRNSIEFRTGTPNFFAITHYNRSYFYATSVADLAYELQTRLSTEANARPQTM